MGYAEDLKEYRSRSGVRQGELARKLGAGTASFVWRRELPAGHRNHVAMTRREYADTIAAIEAIVEERGGPPDPAESLQPAASRSEGSS